MSSRRRRQNKVEEPPVEEVKPVKKAPKEKVNLIPTRPPFDINLVDPEKRAELERAFTSVDTSGNGDISASELKVLFEEFELHDITIEEIQQMIVDVNGGRSDEISLVEFIQVMVQNDTDEDQDCEEAFGYFDADKDGAIDWNELKWVLHILGENSLSNDEIKEMIKRADYDGDGKVGPEDFKKLWANH